MYFDLDFVVGMPGGGVYEQRRVSHLQNINILSPRPESGSAPSQVISLDLALEVCGHMVLRFNLEDAF